MWQQKTSGPNRNHFRQKSWRPSHKFCFVRVQKLIINFLLQPCTYLWHFHVYRPKNVACCIVNFKMTQHTIKRFPHSQAAKCWTPRNFALPSDILWPMAPVRANMINMLYPPLWEIRQKQLYFTDFLRVFVCLQARLVSIRWNNYQIFFGWR